MRPCTWNHLLIFNRDWKIRKKRKIRKAYFHSFDWPVGSKQVERPQVVCATMAVAQRRRREKGPNWTTSVARFTTLAGRVLVLQTTWSPIFPTSGHFFLSCLHLQMRAGLLQTIKSQFSIPRGPWWSKRASWNSLGKVTMRSKSFCKCARSTMKNINPEGVRLAQASAPRDGNEPQPTSSVAVALVPNDATLNAEYLHSWTCPSLSIYMPRSVRLNSPKNKKMISGWEKVGPEWCFRSELQINSQLSIFVDSAGTSVNLDCTITFEIFEPLNGSKFGKLSLCQRPAHLSICSLVIYFTITSLWYVIRFRSLWCCSTGISKRLQKLLTFLAKENCFLLEAVASMMAGMPLRFWIPDLKMWFRAQSQWKALLFWTRKGLGTSEFLALHWQSCAIARTSCSLGRRWRGPLMQNIVFWFRFLSFIHEKSSKHNNLPGECRILSPWSESGRGDHWIWKAPMLLRRCAQEWGRTTKEKNVKRKKRMQRQRRKRRQGTYLKLETSLFHCSLIEEFLFWMFSPRPWTVGNTWRFRNFKNTLTYLICFSRFAIWGDCSVLRQQAEPCQACRLQRFANCMARQDGRFKNVVCHLSIEQHHQIWHHQS